MPSSLSLEDRLRRIVYMNAVGPQFYVGDPDKYQLELSEVRQNTIKEVIQNDLKDLFAVLDEANKDKSLPRRSNMFCILGRFMGYKEITPEQKSKITAKVLDLSQSDEDFFNFIKYYTQWREKSKMPSSVEKAVRKFYSNKTPLELAQSVAQHNRMFRWSHKDLIKLAHVKSESPLKNVVINYILTRKMSDKVTEEEQAVLEVLRKSDELRKTEEAVDAIPILATHKLTMHQVSPSLHQNEEVWNAAIENMTIQQILPCLVKLYKHGLLKANTSISNNLKQLFTNPEKVKSSGVHPIEVLIYMKRLEKGGKPMDAKLVHYLQHEKKLSEEDLKKAKTRTEAKCPHILSALSKCFDLACSNITPTNKRYLVTIDVTAQAKAATCIGSKVLSFLEAAVAHTIVLLRAEKDVVVGTFKDDKIELISVQKNVSFSDLLEKVKAKTSTYSPLFSAIDWANKERKHVDVFVSFIHNSFFVNLPKDKPFAKVGCEQINKYRSKVNLPKSKCLIFAPVSRDVPSVPNLPSNVIYVCGFDVTACRAAECFARGAFS